MEAVASEVWVAQESSGLLQGLGGLHRKMGEVDGTVSCWVRVSCCPADKATSKRLIVSSLRFQYENVALGQV